MATDTWELLSPVGEPERSEHRSAERTTEFSGKTVGLFWNGKPGSNVFLEEVGREIAARHPGVTLTRFWETRPSTMTSYGNSKEDLAYMAAHADLVIAASSD